MRHRIQFVALALALCASTALAQSPAPAKAGDTTHKQATAAKRPKGQAALRAQAKVSEDAARATALAEVPGGTVKSSELEREKGTLIYSFDIAVAGKAGIEEVHVDAITGKVIAREHESPAKEKAEARKDAKAGGKQRKP